MELWLYKSKNRYVLLFTSPGGYSSDALAQFSLSIYISVRKDDVLIILRFDITKQVDYYNVLFRHK